MDTIAKIRKIRSLTISGGTTVVSSVQTYFQCWQMLYTSLIGATTNMRISNGYVGKYQRLILSLTDYNYIFANYETSSNVNNTNISIKNENNNDATIWYSVTKQSRSLYRFDDCNYNDSLRKLKEQLNKLQLNLNDLKFEMRIARYEIGSNCGEYLTFYDKLLTIATPWTKNKIILKVMVEFDDTTKYKYYKYHHSHLFLSTLTKDSARKEWKNLDKFFLSVQWNFQFDQLTRKQLYSSNYSKPCHVENSILTNPSVPLTSRKEFEFSDSKHGNISCITINTTTNFTYKCLGNIFHNFTKWMASYCRHNKDKNETLNLQVCVNITSADAI